MSGAAAIWLLTNATGDNSSLTAPYKFFTIHRAIAV